MQAFSKMQGAPGRHHPRSTQYGDQRGERRQPVACFGADRGPGVAGTERRSGQHGGISRADERQHRDDFAARRGRPGDFPRVGSRFPGEFGNHPAGGGGNEPYCRYGQECIGNRGHAWQRDQFGIDHRQRDQGDRRSDQPAGPQRRHRGSPGRRAGPRLRRGGRRGAQAGRTDDQVDARNHRNDCPHSEGGRRRGGQTWTVVPAR